jgi:MFS family permease
MSDLNSRQTEESIEKKPSGYFELLSKNDRFRWLWSGQVVSLLGDWFNLVASAALIGELTRSAVAVGGLFVVRWLAPVIVSPLAGVVADRYNRKHILIATDILRAIIVLGFLLIRDVGDIWLLYTLTAAQLALAGFFFPARNAILPSIVSPRELGAANALSSATWSVMLALGTGIGGLIAGFMGVNAAFLLDSLSFLVSAALIGLLRYQPRPSDARETRGLAAGVHQYVDGLRYLRRNLDIFRISLLKAAAALTANGALAVIQVRLAEEVFVIGKGGAVSMGIIFAVVGVGTGVGPIFARIFTKDEDRRLRQAIFWGFVILSAGVATMALAQHFWLLLIGVFIRGVGGGINWVFSTQLLMQLLPEDIRGRVFSTEFAFVLLAGSTSAALVGPTIDLPAVGLTGTMWGMAALALVPAILWGLYVKRRPTADVESDSD